MIKLETGLILTVISIVFSFAFSFLTHRRNSRKDIENLSEVRGVLQSDVGYIKAGVDDLKRENRAVNEKLETVVERVTRVEESCKQAHKRIHEIKETEHI